MRLLVPLLRIAIGIGVGMSIIFSGLWTLIAIENFATRILERLP